jgi:hypothetical protein
MRSLASTLRRLHKQNQRLTKMKKLTIIAIAICALTAPAHAKEKCTSMCHFYEAWAITKLCTNLTLNDGWQREDRDLAHDKAFRKTHDILKRQVLKETRADPDACNIDCQWRKEAPDGLEGTPCQYLILKEDAACPYSKPACNVTPRK